MLQRFILFLVLSTASFAGEFGGKVYFSPNGGCEQALVQAINASQKTADIAIYSINDPGIKSAIMDAAKRGVVVRMICDKTEAAGKNSATKELIAQIPMHVQHGSKGGIMHIKMAVLDSEVVVLGSFNFTTRAEAKNDEIEVILKDKDLAAACEKKFEEMWNRKINKSFSRQR